MPSAPAAVEPAIDAWVRAPAVMDLVREFQRPDDTPMPDALDERLDWLEAFSERWDYRGGKERNLVASENFVGPQRQQIIAAARALGLMGELAPSADRYDHVLILGGLVRACFARPIYTSRLMADARLRADTVTALGGYRELKGNEFELAAAFDAEGLTDEFDAMDAGVREAFGVSVPTGERGEYSETVGESWRVRDYAGPDGTGLRVVAAPSSEPGIRRANTPDTYAWFATELAKLEPGERVLVVTTAIYVPFQHADAVRMLALPYGVDVETVGVRPGAVDARLEQTFEPHQYLQEIRSTIRSLRFLHRELSASAS